MATLRAVTLDCADPRALARFYAGVMGAEVTTQSDDFAALATSDGAWIGFQRVAVYKPPSWPTEEVPQQMHLDLAADDLDAAEKAVLAMGATKPLTQPGGERWRVFLDPEGHPFCLVAAR